MAAGSIVIDLMLRSGSFETDTKRAERELERLRKQAQRLGTSNTFSPLEKGMAGVGRSAASATQSVDALGTSLRSMAGYVAAAFSVGQVINYADAWTAAQGRLKLVVDESQNLADVNAQLFDVAQRTRQPLEATINFYSRLAQFIPEAERAQYDLLGVTESVTSALAITGETSASAMGAMIQFTQAIGTNFEASGQELRSLQEQAPRLTQALMKAFGDGTKSLQTLKQEGILTRKSVLDALSGVGEQGKKLREELEKVPVTFSQSLTRARNSILMFIGDINDSTGGVQYLASGIELFAKHIDLAVVAVSTFIGLKFASKIASVGIALIRSTQATKEFASSQMIAAQIAKGRALAAVEVAKADIAAATQSLNAAKTDQQATTAALRLDAARRRLVTANNQLFASTNALSAATANYTKTASLAATAGRGLLALAGGPIGAITIAVTAGVLAWQTWGDSGDDAIKKILSHKDDLSQLREGFEELTRIQQKQAILQVQAELQSSLKDYKSEMDKILKTAMFEVGFDIQDLVSTRGQVFSDFRKQIDELFESASSVNELDSGLQDIINSIVKTSEGGEDLRKKLEKLAVSVIEYRREVDKTTSALNAMKEAQNRQSTSSAAEEGMERNKKALEDFMNQFATKTEQLEAARKKWKEALGELYSPDVDKRIVERFSPRSSGSSAIDDGQRLIKQMKERIALIGAETETEKLLANISSGAIKLRTRNTQAQIEELKTLAQTLDNISESERESARIAEERAKLMQEGKSMAESMLTPAQLYNNEVERLKLLQSEGAISMAVYLQAMNNVQQKYFEMSEAGKKVVETQSRINAMLEATPSAALEKTRKDMQLLASAFTTGFEDIDGQWRKLSESEYLEAVSQRLGLLGGQTEVVANEMSEFMKQAARNMQDAMADGFFNIMEGKFDNLVGDFTSMINRMVANLMASQLMNFLIGDFGKTGNMGGFLGDIFGGFFGGAKAGGGDVIPGRSYLVGERGPEMFTPRTTGSIMPSAQLAGGGEVRVYNNFTIQGTTDRRSQMEIAARAGEAVNRAMQRNR